MQVTSWLDPVEEIPSLSNLAHELHTKIMKEQSAGGYDPYKLRAVGYLDKHEEPLVNVAIDKIKSDELSRQFVKGPSCIREKFTSKYWRTWNVEKNVLEDFSRVAIRKEMKEKEKEDERIRRNRKKVVPPLKRDVMKGVPAVSFAPPVTNLRGAGIVPATPTFDAHLLGTANTPHNIITKILKQQIPVDSRESHSSYEPDAIGNKKAKGGIMLGKPSYHQHSETKNCKFLPPATLVDPAKGSTFASASRFKQLSGSSNNANSTDDPDKEYLKLPSGHVFSKDIRFSGLDKPNATVEDDDNNASGVGGGSELKDATPGPGAYNIERLFDGKNAPDMAALVQKHSANDRGLFYLSEERKPALAKMAVFGHGCSRQEHILYGMCLDGRCCKRSGADQTVLRSNNILRLSGYPGVDQWGIKIEGAGGRKEREELAVSRALLDILPAAIYEVTPLYAAAYQGDCAKIEALARLGVAPNIPHPQSGYTALHVAVFRCHQAATKSLLDCFRGQILTTAQCRKGDTPLHIASRGGFVEIADILCSEEDLNPNAHANNEQLTPIQICKSHRVFQSIQLCQNRWDLRLELRELRRVRPLHPHHPNRDVEEEEDEEGGG